jgi:hypothetical protein
MQWFEKGEFQVGQSPFVIPQSLTGSFFKLYAWMPSHPDANGWVRGGWISQYLDDNSFNLGRRILLNKKIFYRANTALGPYRLQVTPPQYLLGYTVKIWESELIATVAPDSINDGHTADISFDLDFD